MHNKSQILLSTNRRRIKVPIYFNFLVSALLFLLLIQLFDPSTISHPTTQQLLHNDNPILQSVSGTRNKHQTTSNLWLGRERLYQLLQDAQLAPALTAANISTLPTQDTIDSNYGTSVVMVGMDDCEAYRAKVPLKDRILAVAGMFNTGTNLLDNQLRKNMKLSQPSLWQVPWGKHRMPVSKWNHTAPEMDKYNKTAVLPVVVIRHPLAWLASMCSHPYAAIWRRNSRCPNLVVTPQDENEFPHLKKKTAFPVTVKFDAANQEHFDSLVHLWSEWYRQYFDADYPILMVRFEDLVFAPAVVLGDIASCAGGQSLSSSEFHYQTKTSKAHGSGTDMLAAIRKTAKLSPLNLPADTAYAQQHLDAELMRLFHYAV